MELKLPFSVVSFINVLKFEFSIGINYRVLHGVRGLYRIGFFSGIGKLWNICSEGKLQLGADESLEIIYFLTVQKIKS